MRKKVNLQSTKSGFTIIEVSLAMSFIAVLLIVIALTISGIMTTFQKGITLKSVNTVVPTLLVSLRPPSTLLLLSTVRVFVMSTQPAILTSVFATALSTTFFKSGSVPPVTPRLASRLTVFSISAFSVPENIPTPGTHITASVETVYQPAL